MADKKSRDMNNEALLKQENTQNKHSLSGRLCIGDVVFRDIPDDCQRRKFNAFLVIALSFIPIIVLSVKSLKATRKERAQGDIGIFSCVLKTSYFHRPPGQVFLFCIKKSNIFIAY